MVKFDNWAAVGARARFKRDTSGGTSYPAYDLGIVASVSPTVTPTTIELRDPHEGLNQLQEETVVQIDENWDLTLRSFDPSVREFLFFATPAETVTVVAADIAATHAAFIGHLVKLQDTDGDDVNPVSAVAGIYFGGDGVTTVADTITAINIATKTLTVTTDFAAVLSPGDFIIIPAEGLVDPLNAGTKTVDEVVNATTVTVVEDFGGAANEAAVTVDLIHNQGSGDGTILDPAMWEVDSLDEGFIRILPTATITGATATTSANVTVIFRAAALTGRRLLKPQTSGKIEGTMWIDLRRNNGAKKTLRKCRVSLAPQSADLQAADYSSWVLRARVLSDITETTPAGTLLDHVGTLPDVS